MDTELLQLLVSIAGLAIALIGLPMLYFQLRDVERSIRGASHAAMYQQAAEVRSHLVAHPHLRKYFFDAVDIQPGDPDYERAVTIAELFLNYLEHIAVLSDSFGERNVPALQRFSRTTLARSPLLRRHLAENRASYSDALHPYPGSG